MLRALILISIFFPPERGGGATGAWNRAMVFHKIGYSVFVVSSFPAYPTGKVMEARYKRKFFYIEQFESIIVIRLRLLPLEYAGYVRRLALFINFVFLAIIYLPKILRIVGRKNIEITYARSPVIFSAIIGLFYSKASKSFFIYEAPDLWPEEFLVYKTKLLPLIALVGKFCAKFSYAVPHVIVTVSKLAALHITKYYTPKASVYGIPVGVDPTKFRRMPKDECRAELIKQKVFPSNIEGKFIVLYSGVISSIYRLESLVYAAELMKNDKDIVFLLIGEGSEKRRLYNLKLESKIDNFHLQPSQPREIMPLIISASDVCVILLANDPIYNIVLPIRFYEYLSCCKPLITYAQGELADIVKSNNIGYTVKVGDTSDLVNIIRKLRNSEKLMNDIEENARKALQKYSLDTIASEFLSLLEKEPNFKSRPVHNA